MQVVEIVKKSQQYAFPKDISKLFGYKSPTRLLQSFREFADENPRVFGSYKPYIKNQGLDTLYSIICFAFYIEYKDLLEAGTRSVSFNKELPRLREVYQ